MPPKLLKGSAVTLAVAVPLIVPVTSPLKTLIAEAENSSKS
jgi:hypothetical protein